METITVKDKNVIISRFDIQQEWDHKRKNNRKYKVSIALDNITKEESERIGEQLRGDNPKLAFGRFEFNGSLQLL